MNSYNCIFCYKTKQKFESMCQRSRKHMYTHTSRYSIFYITLDLMY